LVRARRKVRLCGGPRRVPHQRLDLSTLSIDAQIALEGFDVPPNNMVPPEYFPLPGNDRFNDAQIDHDGVLYAAHEHTGRVLVYDTKAQMKPSELQSQSRTAIDGESELVHRVVAP
jgi:hypothetical protein